MIQKISKPPAWMNDHELKLNLSQAGLFKRHFNHLIRYTASQEPWSLLSQHAESSCKTTSQTFCQGSN